MSTTETKLWQSPLVEHLLQTSPLHEMFHVHCFIYRRPMRWVLFFSHIVTDEESKSQYK